MPEKTGLLTIPALGVLLKGKTYRTRPIEVTVLPGGGTPRQGGRQLGPRTPPRRPGEPGGARAGGAAEVQLRSEVDKRSVYVGEQLTVSFLLATQTEVLNLQLAGNPTFPGFWTEDIKLPENLDMRRVQIGGHAFNEYTLLKKVLFPTTVGRLTIPAVRYRIQVRRRTRDAFESFFLSDTFPVEMHFLAVRSQTFTWLSSAVVTI